VEDERDTIKILKVWSYQWRRKECTTEKTRFSSRPPAWLNPSTNSAF